MEIRSVNHRYFEFSLRIPPAFSALEGRVREMVQQRMPRGKISVSIGQEMNEEDRPPLSINEKTAEFYLQTVKKLAKKYKIQNNVSASDILRLPGIFTEERKEIAPEKVWPIVKKILARVLDQIEKAREDEGRKLAADIFLRLTKIEQAVESVTKWTAGDSERIFKKLCDRIDVLMKDKEKDTERFHREAAFLAERSDITEEVVRLGSHLDLFRKRLHSNGEVGRELDFVCQEMNREANTIASKSQFFDISNAVVQVKGEIEKIREQIQNIE